MSPLLLLLLALPALSVGFSCPYGKELEPNSPVPPAEKCRDERSANCIKGIVELEKDGKIEIKHYYGCEEGECREFDIGDKKCKDITHGEKYQKKLKKIDGTGKFTACCSKDGKFD